MKNSFLLYCNKIYFFVMTIVITILNYLHDGGINMQLPLDINVQFAYEYTITKGNYIFIIFFYARYLYCL